MEEGGFITLSSKNELRYDEENVPFHHLSRQKGKKYDPYRVRQIQIIYLIAVILWIVLVFVFQWFRTGIIGLVILAIPIVVFGINYYYACSHTIDLEADMFQGNFLSFAFLTAIILINWTKIPDKRRIFSILMIALILIMLSLIDIWVTKSKFILVKHIRTTLQTAALTLLALALYMYYSDAIRFDTGLDEK